MSTNLTIDKIKQIIKSDDFEPSFIEQLESDPRKGVANILKSYYQKLEKQRDLINRFEKLKSFDEKYKIQEDTIIVGVDEVGRGPLAGPVVTCAIILEDDFDCIEVFDSKKLNKKQRKELFDKIISKTKDYAIGIKNADVIDEINIYQAAKVAMHEAVNDLKYIPEIILSDAMDIKIPNSKNYSLIKGDMKSLSIAAASIIAKDIRDDLMEQYDEIYPEYDFKNNSGYGTKKHLQALDEHGYTKIHRQSFDPVKATKKANQKDLELQK